MTDRTRDFAIKAWAGLRRRVSTRPRLWAGAAGAALVLFVLAAGTSQESGRTVTVREGDLVTTVAVTGTLQAVDADYLGPPSLAHMWNFSIARMVPEGTVVKKGGTVLVFDTSDLLRELKEKQTEGAEATKQMEKKTAELQIQKEDGRLKRAEAEANLRKIKMLLDVPADLKSANDLKKTGLDLAAAEAEVAGLKASQAASMRAGEAELASLKETKQRADDRVREIQDAIKRMDVKAPSAGTVIYQTDWQGNKKAVGDRCWVGEKVLEVAGLDHMKAEGEVDEVDSGKIAPGQRVVLRLDASPDVAYTGRIKSVWGALQVKSPTNPLKVVKLDIYLDRTDTRHMMPGMRFSGTIDTGAVWGAMVVPADAVSTGPSGPEVLKKTLFGWRRTKVVIGKRSKTDVQVLSGLSPGDRVLVKPQEGAAG